MTTFWLAVLLAWSAPDASAALRARVYDQVPVAGVVKVAPCFEVHVTREQKGEVETLTQVARDAQGALYSEQVTRFEKGQLREYQVKNPSLKLVASARVEGARVHYESELEGKKGSGESDYSDHFAVGPASLRYIENHYSDFASGRTVMLDIGIPGMGRSIEFKLIPVESEPAPAPDSQWLKVSMRPTSLLFSALMSSAHYYFDRKSQRLVRYVGPTEFVKPGHKRGFVGTMDFIAP